MLRISTVLLLTTFLFLPDSCLGVRPADCYMGTYNYSGLYFSDEWTMNIVKEKSSCDVRKGMDAVKLNSDWKVNNTKINDLIERMLKEPRCQNAHQILEKYKTAVQSHRSDYDILQGIRTNWMKEEGHTLDIQRCFAYGQFWNSYCSGQYTQKTIFIDIETINTILPPKPDVSHISKNGELVEDCSSIRASGKQDLNKFKVSTAKAKGTEILITYDVYSLPDQVLIMNGSGDILHDSGCKSKSKEFGLKIPLADVGPSKLISVEINQNCDGNHSGSKWDFSLQCESEGTDPCSPEKNELAELLKQQVANSKQHLDLNIAEGGCMLFVDETILPWLYKEGLVKLLEGTSTNNFCKFLDNPNCDLLSFDPDLELMSKIPVSSPSKKPASVEKEVECPEKPNGRESVLKLISWSYCTTGRPRLDVKK